MAAGENRKSKRLLKAFLDQTEGLAIVSAYELQACLWVLGWLNLPLASSPLAAGAGVEKEALSEELPDPQRWAQRRKMKPLLCASWAHFHRGLFLLPHTDGQTHQSDRPFPAGAEAFCILHFGA